MEWVKSKDYKEHINVLPCFGVLEYSLKEKGKEEGNLASSLAFN
jgi:hypothetical protein